MKKNYDAELNPKNIHISHGKDWKLHLYGGLKGMYEAKLKFPQGQGIYQRDKGRGGVNIHIFLYTVTTHHSLISRGTLRQEENEAKLVFPECWEIQTKSKISNYVHWIFSKTTSFCFGKVFLIL